MRYLRGVWGFWSMPALLVIAPRRMRPDAKNYVSLAGNVCPYGVHRVPMGSIGKG